MKTKTKGKGQGGEEKEYKMGRMKRMRWVG